MTKVLGWVFVSLFSIVLAAGCGAEPPKEAPKLEEKDKADMKASHDAAAKGTGGAPAGGDATK